MQPQYDIIQQTYDIIQRPHRGGGKLERDSLQEKKELET